MKTILLSAGDLSGERHAAQLVREIRARRSDTRFVGMGGGAMAAVGVELVVDQRELAVGGIFEVVTSSTRVYRAWRKMKKCVSESNPDLVVLIDSGGFNLPLARHVRRHGRAKILYYIAPQIWAWREKRITKLANRTDRIAVILPFEKDYYAARDVHVDFVGHPLLDQISPEEVESAKQRKCRARMKMGVSEDDPIVGLFPGSRRSEVGQHLDLFVESFRELRRRRPDVQAVLVRAPTLDHLDFDARLSRCGGEAEDAIRVVEGDSEGLDAVDVALTKPGTITTELMLRGCPMVVAGRVHPWTARIVRRSLRAAYLSMPNLLAGKAIVPEHFQGEATPRRLADAIETLLVEGGERSTQIADLAAARSRMGSPGASKRVAEIVEDLLGTASA